MLKPFGRIRRRTVSGIAVLIPLFVTIWVLRGFFGFTAGILLPILDPAVDDWPDIARNALSVGILFLLVYALGEIAAHVLGRQALALVDAVLMRVPVIRVIYRASRRVVTAFESQEGSAFKSVVFVEFPHPGMRSVGFVTSTFPKTDGSTWHTVFVPTAPNPTSGFLQVLPATGVFPTDFSVEEAFQMVMSMGVLSPTRLAETP